MSMKKMFKNMKIKTQLMSSFLLVTAITFAVLIIALVNMNRMASAIDGLYHRALLPLDYVTQSTRLMEHVKTAGRGSLLAKDPQTREAAANQILDDVAKTKEYMTEFGKTIVKPTARGPYNTLITSLDEYVIRMAPFRLLLQEDLAQPANLDKAVIYIESTLSPLSDACLESLVTLNSIRLGLGQELMTSAISSSRITFYSMTGFSAAGLLLTVILGFYFSAYLSKPILKGVEVVTSAAEGDFTVSLPSYGAEIGRLYSAFNLLLEYNRMNISAISATSTTMRESAQNMLSISSQMAGNSKGLNAQTSRVSSAVEEFSAGMTQSSGALSTASKHISAVASSIEEINATIATVAAAAVETSTRVEQTGTLVENIKDSILSASSSVTLVSEAFNSVASSVGDINKSIIVINDHCAAAMPRMSSADAKAKSTNLIIQQLETASRQIGKIVSIISDVADQTNMLAINAAIEAAGAGDAGKGFMVVAGEVKELAKQTANSANEIAEQIEDMRKNMPKAVDAVSEIAEVINDLTEFMESLTREIKQQGKRSDQIADESASAARRMQEITTEIGRISENAHSVTVTALDCTHGVNEIAKSTADLVIGTQEIAMNSERASSNISEIDRATKEMTAGLVEISQNIQMIHTEAGAVQDSADQTNRSSEELFSVANEMEKFTSKFKI